MKRAVLAIPLFGLLALAPAMAGTLGAEQGLAVLAKAKAADSKCSYLSASKHRELSGYLARAEIAAQNLMSATAASAAIASGRAEGRSQSCSRARGRDVADTLEAARLAIAEADSVKPRRPAKAKPAGLEAYRELVAPYLVDLRCKQLSGPKARRYYEEIKDLQSATVARHGTTAVVNAQANARRAAQAVKCGETSRQMAEEGLAAIVKF